MSNVSRSNRADIAVAYGLDQGNKVTAQEQAQIDAAIASGTKPTTVFNALGPGGDDVLALHIKGDGSSPAKTFFAVDSFAFGPKPPLKWQEAPKHDRSDVRAEGIATFFKGTGTPATAEENQAITDALKNGAQMDDVFDGLDLGDSELKEVTIPDADGQQKTFITKDTFAFGNAPPLKWVAVPSND